MTAGLDRECSQVGDRTEAMDAGDQLIKLMAAPTPVDPSPLVRRFRETVFTRHGHVDAEVSPSFALVVTMSEEFAELTGDPTGVSPLLGMDWKQYQSFEGWALQICDLIGLDRSFEWDWVADEEDHHAGGPDPWTLGMVAFDAWLDPRGFRFLGLNDHSDAVLGFAVRSSERQHAMSLADRAGIELFDPAVRLAQQQRLRTAQKRDRRSTRFSFKWRERARRIETSDRGAGVASAERDGTHLALRDRLAADHVGLLKETHDRVRSTLVDLDERTRSGDESALRFIGYGNYAVTLITAMYSLGAGFDEMREQARRIPGILLATEDRIFDPSRNGGSVRTLIDASALVALFEDQRGAAQMSQVVDRFDIQDYLIDSYIGSLIDFRDPSPQLQMHELARTQGFAPPQYEGQKAAAELAISGDDHGASERLVRYVLKEWFRSHAAGDWVPPHRARNFYAGLWCFTGAATAKVFGIDDSGLRGHERYPWDLAHPH